MPSDSLGVYKRRIESKGGTLRGAAHKREVAAIYRHIPDNLSYNDVVIDGEERVACVLDSDNLNEKTIISMPGQDILAGAYVDWMEHHWLVTERDPNTTIHTRAKMILCNYLLKWVSDDDRIIEQWCYVEDGTKYLTGEYEDRYVTITRGDSRIAVTIARNDETKLLGRKNRFMIDDPDSPMPLCYQLTKPFKLTGVYGDETGVYKFVMAETPTTEDDNVELRIADFYKHFPKNVTVDDSVNVAPSERKVWL